MSSDIEIGTRMNRVLALPLSAILTRLMSGIERGRLTIRGPRGLTLDRQSGKPGPEAVLVLHRWRGLRRLLTGGDVAFAEAYADGDWSSPDITALLELAAANLPTVQEALSGLLPVRALNRLRPQLRPNSRRGSRRNIAFHYDLGNDFYRAWLDPSMTYSSAIYASGGETLEQAQENKLGRIVELLAPQAGQKVLEIGSGWGALAARIGRTGADVKGITLSTEQLASGWTWRTTATARENSTGSSRSRCSKPSARGTGRPISNSCAGFSRRTAARYCRSSPSMKAATSATGSGPTSSRRTSFPAACCRRSHLSPNMPNGRV
jgi:cyclopropane-fatty-acyl-phospholipid synthase